MLSDAIEHLSLSHMPSQEMVEIRNFKLYSPMMQTTGVVSYDLAASQPRNFWIGYLNYSYIVWVSQIWELPQSLYKNFKQSLELNETCQCYIII